MLFIISQNSMFRVQCLRICKIKKINFLAKVKRLHHTQSRVLLLNSKYKRVQSHSAKQQLSCSVLHNHRTSYSCLRTANRVLRINSNSMQLIWYQSIWIVQVLSCKLNVLTCSPILSLTLLSRHQRNRWMRNKLL
jgi:hypothetical protein